MSDIPNKVMWYDPKSKQMGTPQEIFVIGNEPPEDKEVPRLSTGLVAQDGQEIFDEDIIVAKDKPEEGQEQTAEVIVDRVHWEVGAWRLGEYDGTLADFILIKIEGNTFEKPWPQNQA